MVSLLPTGPQVLLPSLHAHDVWCDGMVYYIYIVLPCIIRGLKKLIVCVCVCVCVCTTDMMLHILCLKHI